jgi:hypothetical protein
MQPSQCAFSMRMLKVLYGTLVLLGGFTSLESTKVSPLTGFGIELSRVQTELAGLQFSNHNWVLANGVP